MQRTQSGNASSCKEVRLAAFCHATAPRLCRVSPGFTRLRDIHKHLVHAQALRGPEALQHRGDGL